MLVYQGVVKGNVVVLPKGVHLEEGLTVEVRLAQPTENLFKQQLMALGLLKEAKVLSNLSPLKKRTPIQVKGQPLSQIIIQERR